MAVDPATIAKIASAILQQLKDEENRKRLLVLLMLPMILLILIIGSPVAIFFAVVGNPATPGQGEESIAIVMVGLESELLNKVDAENATGDYDEVEVIYEGSEDNTPIINVQDVIAVFSVLDNMGKLEENPEAVARLTPEQVELLKKTFWEMNLISIDWRQEEIPYDSPPLYDEHGNRLPDPPPTIKRIKIITINSLGYEEVMTDFFVSQGTDAVYVEANDHGHIAWFSQYYDMETDARSGGMRGYPHRTPGRNRAGKRASAGL